MKTTAQDFLRRLRLALVVAMPLLSGAAWAEEEGKDVAPAGIAATVNGHAIPRSEVHFLLAPKLQQLKERFPQRGTEFDEQLMEARNDVMKELTDRRIVIEDSKNLRIQITSERVEEEVKREITDSYEGDAGRLRVALAASRMTMEGYRSMLRDRLLEGEVKKQLAKGE